MNQHLSKPLSEDEIQKLEDMLSGFNSESAMTIEGVDGLFAAFHCSPHMVPFNDYLSLIWGDETGKSNAPFKSPEDLQNFITLLMRYWNEVGRRFGNEIFFPHLLTDKKTGKAKGNDWAKGFIKGAQIAGGFEGIMESEDEGGTFLPIFILAYEHNDDASLRPYKEKISYKKREALFLALAACVTRIYHILKSARIEEAGRARERVTSRRTEEKVGRNDPCPCGSGIKHKKCCLNITIH